MLYCKETILLLLGRENVFTKQKSKSYAKSREGFDECLVDVAAEWLDAHCLTYYEIQGPGVGKELAAVCKPKTSSSVLQKKEKEGETSQVQIFQFL